MRKSKIITAVLAVTVLTGFSVLAIDSGATAEKLEVKSIKLESTEAKLKDVNLQVDKLKEQSSTDKEKYEQLQKEKAELEKQLQAKAEAKAKLAKAAEDAANALTATQKVSAAAPAVAITGDKHSWMTAAGIPEHEWGYVNSIVTRESGWNPNAVNKSSGACGLGQQLPCGKWAGAWNDPVAALRAMTGYVTGRYGGWAQAVAFWNANHWY